MYLTFKNQAEVLNLIPKATEESEQKKGGVIPACRRHGPEHRIDKHRYDKSGPPAVNVAFK